MTTWAPFLAAVLRKAPCCTMARLHVGLPEIYQIQRRDTLKITAEVPRPSTWETHAGPCPGSNEASSSGAARHTDDLAFQGWEILLKVVEPRWHRERQLSTHVDVYTYEVRCDCTYVRTVNARRCFCIFLISLYPKYMHLPTQQDQVMRAS